MEQHLGDFDRSKLIPFLVRAKSKTYAGKGAECAPSRLQSHDLTYSEVDLFYMDSFLGGEKFSGEEALWVKQVPVWSMNYTGRVLDEKFSGDFLKEALLHVPITLPYRGPEFYRNGKYTYICKVDGEFDWFRGHESIFCDDKKVYELYFHGGSVVQ